MITYNHEAFIAQAIEGVLMQETDFPVELVIGEDCSTDRTREIALSYQEKFPDKVRVLVRDANLGMGRNFIDTFSNCRGKYIAMCEGDDYWKSIDKLSRQVQFLETHSNYSGVCSSVQLLDEDTGQLTPETICSALLDEDDIDFDSLLHKLIIYTPTLLFRREFIELALFKEHYIFGDLITHLLLLEKGQSDFKELTMSFTAATGAA